MPRVYREGQFWNVWVKRSTVYRVQQWAPLGRSFVRVLTPTREFLFDYLKWNGGLRLHAVRCRETRAYLFGPVWVYPKELSMKKRERLGLSNTAPKPASTTSVLWGKLPLLREWCSATAYEDGQVREPGAVRITTRNAIWSITVTDPDRCAKLTVSDESLDKALQLVEQLLGVETTPWELDEWRAARQPKKGKK